MKTMRIYDYPQTDVMYITLGTCLCTSDSLPPAPDPNVDEFDLDPDSL